VSRFLAQLIYRFFQQNNPSGSRRNIAAHYDLGNDFFELFLDPTLSYSCALYPEQTATLEEAQIAKIDRLIDKLDLDASQHLLEIGSGWGALAIRAAQRTGCRVTTITLSERQLETTHQRVREAGLSDRVEVRLTDYRDLTPPHGGFDKFVSVEMIEAVGRRYYPAYFRRLSELIRPEGRGVIQAITIADQRFERASREVDFIKKYIFPGSCIPSVQAMSRAATTASDLRLTHLEDFSPHYTRTLLDWRDNLRANREAVLSRGYPPALLRMWEFYLAYCAGGFAERNIGLVQIEWRKPDCRDQPLCPEPLRHPRGTGGRGGERSDS
jgi:cyclopropane-fatty-acyl-phospholipid synthase